MKKAFSILVMALILLAFCVALVAASIFVDEEDRDPDSGLSYPYCAYAWARLTAHYDTQTGKYTNVAHYHDGYSFFNYYIDTLDSDDDYHPKTHTYTYVWYDDDWVEGAHAKVVL